MSNFMGSFSDPDQIFPAASPSAPAPAAPVTTSPEGLIPLADEPPAQAAAAQPAPTVAPSRAPDQNSVAPAAIAARGNAGASTVGVPRPTASDVEAVEQFAMAYRMTCEQLAKVIVGQQEVIEQVLTAMFCQGHVLLVGVPGLAKTLLVKTISDVLELEFKRVQFTPDLMPSDITGTDVLEEDRATGRRQFRFVRGPLFANIVLADEINRTPPKTQAALLEAMQEHRVTTGDNTYTLPEPFFVLATQNPIEQEGTYPLPEAQLDRFMFMTLVKYPDPAQEILIMKQATAPARVALSRLLDGPMIMELQQIVRRVPVADHVYTFARDLVRSTRPKEKDAPDWLADLVQWGAGPRASIYLILAGKARAILHGRMHVTTDDIVQVAHPVLRHRILTTFNAEANGMTSDSIIDRLIKEVLRNATAA